MSYPQRSKPAGFDSALRAAQLNHPEQRTCQILVNALGEDPFYMEDAQAIVLLYAYARGEQPRAVEVDRHQGE